MTKHNYIYYGTKTTAHELTGFIDHMIEVNDTALSNNRKRVPLCVWGRHGVGKTYIVEEIAQKKGYDFAYIAPAQFEEMGDLVGMPKIENGRTVFTPPEWVPSTEGPGILLIDDVNRADDRILRGIMQLLQNYELVSWKIPPGWHIILTANPDGGDYSVTPMDDAMITRMMHITLLFEVKAWAHWAEANGVDPRGINFVLTYPEIVTGDRTTPRTLVQFFESIAHIEDLEEQIPLVQMLADSCLDQNAATSFINFVKNNLSKLISPEEILAAKNFDPEVHSRLHEVVQKEVLRVDILATLCTRLINYLMINNIKPTDKELDNIKQFLLLDFLPNDLRLTTARDMVSVEKLKMIMTDKDIGKLLLSRM
ncbi:MAG: AAA family ATPase [bacterium]|nr:AAA family ATPase [bacterium]